MTGYPASHSGARMASDPTIGSSTVGLHLQWAKEGIHDQDNEASVGGYAIPRR